MSLGIVELLSLRGLNPTAKAKMVRHQHARYPVQELLRHNWLEIYQGYQARPVFHKWTEVVAFYGLSGTRACFWGVFKKQGVRPALEGPTPESCPWAREWQGQCKYFYELERVQGFEDLEERAIIDWGRGALAWHQRLANKPVLELVPKGRRLPPFDDYLEFSLSYGELQELIAQPEAHRDWHASLVAVGGIYLVLAEDSGNLYIGSASGVGGIWARWAEYARTGHGNNQLLRSLIESAPATYPRRLRFSVLQILSKTASRDELLERESLFKQKLGSRSTGLNLN